MIDDGFGVESLLAEGSSFVVAVVVLAGAFKFYQWLTKKDDLRAAVVDEKITDLTAGYEARLDRVRTNQIVLLAHVGALSRLVPVELEVPPLPELLPEVEPEK